MGRGRCKAFNPVTQFGNCIFGSNCRYAHPEDPDWATALPAPLRNDPISSNTFGTGANTTPWTSNGRYSNTNSSMNNTSNSNNSNGWGPPSDSQIAGSSKDASSTGWDRFGSSDWGKTGSSNETSSGWGAASTSNESQTRGGPEASSSSSGNGNGWGTNTGSSSGGNEWGSSGSRNEERSAPNTSPTKRSTRDGGHRNTVSWEDGHRNDSTSRSKDSVNEGGSGWGDKDRSSTIRASGDRHSSRAGASTSWDETRSNSGPSRTHDSSSNNTIRSVGPFGKMNTSSNDSPQYTSQINASPRARSHSGSTNGGRPQDQSSSSHHHSDRQGSRRGLSYATSSSVSSDPRRARADSFTRQQDDIDVDVVPSSPTTPLSPSHGLSSSHSHTSMARKESNGSVSPVVNPLKRKRSEHHSDQGNRTPKRSQDEGVEITENALTEFLRQFVKDFIGAANSRIAYHDAEKKRDTHQSMVSRLGKNNAPEGALSQLGSLMMDVTDRQKEYGQSMQKMVKMVMTMVKNIWMIPLPAEALPAQLGFLQERLELNNTSVEELKTALEELKGSLEQFGDAKQAQVDPQIIQAALEENDRKHQARLDEVLEENKRLEGRLTELELKLQDGISRAQQSADDATLGVLLLKQTMTTPTARKTVDEKTMKDMEQSIMERVFQKLKDAGVDLAS